MTNYNGLLDMRHLRVNAEPGGGSACEAQNWNSSSSSRILCLESRRHFIGRILPQRTTGAPEPGKFAGRHRLRPGTDFGHSFAVLSKFYRLVAVQNSGQHFARFTSKLRQSRNHNVKVHTFHA